ncbi:MAG: CPBP family intramembrane metalloprotease [Thermoleophilaceae bacterium]|nr:CPBP family intramembrane metalloprotease [Thermoleophilaceae bacterium]
MVFGFAAARLARAFGLGATPVVGISAEELFVRTLILDVPIIVGTLLLARWLLRARPADLGLLRPRRADLRYGLIFGTGLFVASIAIGLVQAAAVGKEQQAIAQALLGHRGLAALALDLIAVAVLTPIAEELLFRGVLFGGVRQRLPFIPAAVVATMPFTLVHEPQAWPGVFVLGFGLALAYERMRTLWAPIATHATVNGLPLLLIALSGR